VNCKGETQEHSQESSRKLREMEKSRLCHAENCETHASNMRLIKVVPVLDAGTSKRYSYRVR
jgi:hypothetical protein